MATSPWSGPVGSIDMNNLHKTVAHIYSAPAGSEQGSFRGLEVKIHRALAARGTPGTNLSQFAQDFPSFPTESPSSWESLGPRQPQQLVTLGRGTHFI